MNKWIVPAAVLVALYLYSRKGSAAQNTDGATSMDVADGLRRVADLYGADIARNVERVYRLETANFSSDGYLATRSAGQKAFSHNYPFGWPERFTRPNMFEAPVRMVDNLEATEAWWVVWRDVRDAMQYLGAFLHSHANNPGRWKTLNPGGWPSYNAAVAQMPTPITNAVLNG